MLKVKEWLKCKKMQADYDLKCKKMQADYDLHTYHGIDAEAELTKMLTEEIGIGKGFIKKLQEDYEKNYHK
jgi:hypothetical protein